MKTIPKSRSRAGAAIALLGSITLVGGLFAPIAGANEPNENANEQAFEATGSEQDPDGTPAEGGAGGEGEGETPETGPGENADANAAEGAGNAEDGADNAEVSAAGEGPSENADQGQERSQEVRSADHSNNGDNGAGHGGDTPPNDGNGNPPNDGTPPNQNDNSASNEDRDPPGNNGTIKIDGFPLDDGPGDDGPGDPDNEPHVDCRFAVDFYNYGPERVASLSFTAQPPTGGREVIATRTLTLDDDGAGGGTDHDGQLVVDLTAALADYEPHPQQGYHVKLTVIVDDEDDQGAQVKHKVFWVGPCEDVGGGTDETGSLRIAKRTSGTDETPPTGSFSFTIVCGDDTYQRSVTAGTFETIAGLDTDDDCTVTETNARGADSTTLTVDPASAGSNPAANGRSVVVSPIADALVTVTFTNVFNSADAEPGRLQIAKVLSGTDETPPSGSFPFTIVCGGDTYTEDVTPDSPVTIDDLDPDEDCTVTETSARGADSTSVAVSPAAAGSSAAANGRSVVVSPVADQTVLVTFTNVFNQAADEEVAALRLAKLTNGTGTAPTGSFPFRITCGDDTFTVSVTPGTTLLVSDDLTPGTTCSLTETDARGAASTTATGGNGTYNSATRTFTVTVPAEGLTATVTFTNTFNQVGGNNGGGGGGTTPDEVGGVVITNPVQNPVVTNPILGVVVDRPAPQVVTPDVLAEQAARPPASVEVLGVQVTRGGQLARTGSDLTNLLTLTGMVMLFGGLLLVAQSRKGFSTAS